MPHPIDWPQLKKRCLDDDAFVRELVAVFQKHGTGLLEQLRTAATAGLMPVAQKHAHTLKGSAANLAAEPLRAAALAAENAARTGDPQGLAQLVGAVEAEFARCMSEIERFLATA